jgi:hypothetical protein
MSLASPVLILILIWTVIHGVHYFLKPFRSQSLLPSTSTSRRRRDFWNTSSTQIILKNVHLRAQTTAWNLRHDEFSTTLRKERKLSWALRWFYDLGCVLAVIGMLVGLGLLFWTCGQTAYALTRKVLEDTVPATQGEGLIGRAITSQVRKPNLRHEYESFIKPLVSFGILSFVLYVRHITQSRRSRA